MTHFHPEPTPGRGYQPLDFIHVINLTIGSAAAVDPKLSFAAIGYDGKSCPSHTCRSQYPSGSAQLMGSCYSFPAIDWSRCATSEHSEGLTSGSAARVSFDDLVGALQKRVPVIERDLALIRR